MALIKCNECDKEISDTADVCPHCGFNIARNKIEQQGIELDKKLEPLTKLFKYLIYALIPILYISCSIEKIFETPKDGIYSQCMKNCDWLNSTGYHDMHQYSKCRKECLSDNELRYKH